MEISILGLSLSEHVWIEVIRKWDEMNDMIAESQKPKFRLAVYITRLPVNKLTYKVVVSEKGETTTRKTSTTMGRWNFYTIRGQPVEGEWDKKTNKNTLWSAMWKIWDDLVNKELSHTAIEITKNYKQYRLIDNGRLR